MLRGALAHLKSFAVTLFLVPGLRARDAAVPLDEFSAMGLIGLQSSRGQVAALNPQRQGDWSYRNGQCRQSNVIMT